PSRGAIGQHHRDMANAQISQVFQSPTLPIEDLPEGFRVTLVSTGFRFTSWRPPAVEAGKPPQPKVAELAAPGTRQSPSGPHTVSNFSMTIVSARPSRVHSWKAGSACIASM